MGFFKNWNFKIIKNSAESGDLRNQYRLAECYYKGDVAEQNYDLAAKWYAEAARQMPFREDFYFVRPSAAYMMGMCYKYGRGIEQNDFFAIAMFCDAIKKAANMPDSQRDTLRQQAKKEGEGAMLHMLEQNDNSAQRLYEIGYCYFYNQMILPGNMDKDTANENAIRFLTKAADNGSGDAAAQLYHIFRRKDLMTAKKWLKIATTLNSVIAECWLADLFCSGGKEFDIEKDKERAFNWYKKATENNNHWQFDVWYIRQAWKELGDINLLHKNNKKDADYCYGKYFSKPIEKNPFDYVDVNAYYEIGLNYIDVDNEKAKAMFKKGRDLGDETTRNLCNHYLERLGG